ncbi:MAG TPA: hypothetical protein VJN64_04695 [Terriglobales bacterium]|nr:hypothetical protein [Terriglobales bacterium]
MKLKFERGKRSLLVFLLLLAVTPAAVAQTKTQIQRMPGWQHCTSCAGSGGTGPSSHLATIQGVRSPSLSGSSMEFSLSPSSSFADALWWKQLGAAPAATRFTYDLDFYIQTPQYSQALEFDVNQSVNGKKFIFGTECSMSRHEWDVYNDSGHQWVHTGIACHVAASAWHHLIWQFQRVGSQVHYISVSLDGAQHFVNRSYTARSSSVRELNVAFQMDGDRNHNAYKTWLDNVTLRY